MSKPRKSVRKGGGALVAIGLLFLTSGAVRFYDGFGPAVAREVAAFSEAMPLKNCAPPPDIAALLGNVSTRTTALDSLERELMDRQRTVEIAEEQIALRLNELQAAEASLRTTLTLAEEGAEGDLGRLTAVYESMKPKQAAELFTAMAPEFAAGFLGRMRPDAAASVMAGLEPDTAYRISVILAGRNAGAPKQ